jgi:hypothetical protein
MAAKSKGQAGANKDRHAYTLLGGQQISLGWLGETELAYLEDLKARADAEEDYFELLREIRGPGSRVLADFGGRVTAGAVQSLFFRVATDIVEQAGIQQGRVLYPEESQVGITKKFIGMAEAARLIGVTRQTVHRALQSGKIHGRTVGAGNTWIVDLESALQYKKSRS